MSETQVARTSERSILIADIVSSTELYEKLGNAAARERVRGCLDMLERSTRKFSGTLVKSLGDGVLCSFESGQQAVGAAVAMSRESRGGELEIRVGIHCGEVIEDQGDVFGDAVNTASRIADLAKPNEILVSRDLRDQLPRELRETVRKVPPLTVKGKRQPLELFAILRRDADADLTQTLRLDQTVIVSRGRGSTAGLTLTYDGRGTMVEAGGKVTIGRDPGSDLVVASQHVSRLHARVYQRGGKYMLVDQSANGTFLVLDDGTKLHLVREEVLLHGSGRIYLGADPATTPSEPIRFEVV